MQIRIRFKSAVEFRWQSINSNKNTCSENRFVCDKKIEGPFDSLGNVLVFLCLFNFDYADGDIDFAWISNISN